MRWTSLAGLLWLTASVGHAQSSVDAALQTADAHAQEGDHRAAIAALETARAETPSARLDLSLAVNLAATGSLRDAATLLRALIDAGTNPLVAEVARERLAAIERRLPTLTVMFRDPPPPSSRLMIDGQLEAQLIGARTTTLTLDPGVHVVEVHDADGHVLARTESEVREGQRSEVALMPAGLPPPALAYDQGAAADASTGFDLDEALPWILAGAGTVVLIAVSIAIGVAVSESSPGMGPTMSNVPPVVIGEMD
ncbi:MAG: hypothetical protein SangKO_047320 [Sandaracinaceae bacterium]